MFGLGGGSLCPRISPDWEGAGGEGFCWLSLFALDTRRLQYEEAAGGSMCGIWEESGIDSRPHKNELAAGQGRQEKNDQKKEM